MKATLTFLFILIQLQLLSSQRMMVATRIDSPIKIDGVLEEPVWSQVALTSDFTQLEPNLNQPVTYDTDVRLAYDDEGLYFGAICYQDPATILKELSARDQRNNTDWFGISLDPYQGGLNGWAFIVTAAGVQQDIQFSGGSEDNAWNAVWESAVSFHEEGWSVEIKIPYAAIRFPKEEIQTWNIQFGRELRYLREQSYWNPIDPTIDGFINQCGSVEGIRNVKSPVRLSLTPFVVGYVDHDSGVGAGESTSTSFGAGMDLKYGINDAFTLDMTLIPDFGQVISDNVVVNLGPFEQFFEENRAFFTEGVELFDKGNLFYTRRIGGRPLHYFDVEDQKDTTLSVIDNPTTTQLLNATKVSGRTAKGLGVGVFNAVVDKSYATMQNIETGAFLERETNPITNYNVVVLDQNLPNNSAVSFVNTNTLRFGDDYDANVTGGFYDIRSKSQNYGVEGKVVVSQKYFVNDDTDIGHTYLVSGGKIGGKFRATVTYIEESENYDHNDLGFLFSPNERSIFTNFEYNEFNPKNKDLVRWVVSLSPQYERLYKPNVFTNFAIRGNVFAVYKSRLGVGGGFTVEPILTRDYFEPRTRDFSKYYEFPRNWRMNAFVSTDYRKPFAYDLRANFRHYDEEGRYELIGEFEPRIRINNKFSIFGTITLGTLPNQIGYVSAPEDTGMIEGFADSDVMFGRRDRLIFDNSLRVNYIFNNLMSLSLRVRHYWDRFNYDTYYRVEDNGSLFALDYAGTDTSGNSIFDSNNNIFNIDLFYTWRFAPGSDIVFAWKNAIFTSDDAFEKSYLNNLTSLFNEDQFNSLSLRIIYFLDYQMMAKAF